MLEKNAVKLAKRLASELPDSANVEAVKQDYPETWVVSLGGSFFNYDHIRIFSADELEGVEARFPIMGALRELGKVADKVGKWIIDGKSRHAYDLGQFMRERFERLEESFMTLCKGYEGREYPCKAMLLDSEVEANQGRCAHCRDYVLRRRGRMCGSTDHCWRATTDPNGLPKLCEVCREKGFELRPEFITMVAFLDDSETEGLLQE